MRGRGADCIVIGAGAAGLATARDVSRAGLDVVVLEARGRIGGRIHTVRDPGSPLPVELGAEFLHGQAEEALAVATEARLVVDQLPDTHFWARDGRLEPVPAFWRHVHRAGRDIARRLARSRARDVPFLEYLERSALDPRARKLVLQYVEGYHAADPARISARFLATGSDEAENGAAPRQLRVVSGFDRVAYRLRASCDARLVDIRLNAVAEAIRWDRDGVVVRAAGPAGRRQREWRARTVVVTVPAPVLARGAIAFDPPLPAKEAAARRLPSAHVCKVVLRFREAFWDEDFLRKRLRSATAPPPLNFFHDGGEPVGTWWTPLPTRASTLTAWAGGPKAEMLLDLPVGERLDRVLDSLARSLRLTRRFLDERFDTAWTYDWRADPWSGGAYSYPEVGAVPAQKALARPVDGRVFFAGEATDSRETATVTGAIASGRRAAREVLAALDRS